MEISIIMGSKSDLSLVRNGTELLDEFGIDYEMKILSAHRTPRELVSYVEGLANRGVKVVIAVAGKAAALPGVIAAHTDLPVIGVPVETSLLGLDSLFSIVQMPGGIPVATMGIGKAGMVNGVLFAVHILSLHNDDIRAKLVEYRQRMTEKVLESQREIEN